MLSLDKEVDLRGNPCCSESYVLQALAKGRGDAGIISERLWEKVQKSPEAADLKEVWTSPAFSHCVFTAKKDFDMKRGRRFTELLLAMDPHDALTADVMRLEGTRKWVQGSPDGFEDLLKALRAEQAVAQQRSSP
jgi:ABC-type phosphate/phosphonate transport system substrate-binding protein